MEQITRDDCVSKDSKLMLEKARHHLKNAGIYQLKTIYPDYYNCIMEGYYERVSDIGMGAYIKYSVPIKIYILMRKLDSNKVAMNRGYYEIERAAGTNPLLILSDIRSDHTPKFAFLNYLENRKYGKGMTPIVLFPEEDFSDMKELKMTLEIE